LQYQKAPMLSNKMSSRLVCHRLCSGYQHQQHLHQHIRSMSVYGFGQQWSGALSRGSNNLFLEEAPELSADELQQFDKCQNMISLKGINDKKCLAASVGWGHTALLVSDNNSTNETLSPKLIICGRPHDFQTLMRLRRLPPFMRNFCIKHTVPSAEDEENEKQQSPKEKDSDTNAVYEPSILQRIASYFAGDNEATFNEEECRRYSNVPTLLEIDLPNNESPALEGTKLSNTALESHTSAKISQHTSQPFNTHFQNTLATCAGVTACISQSGHLYTFGLNQRGQCGVGTFTPNIWTPCQVSGLASTRFILDNGTGIDEEIYRTFKQQQYPIVSVALGLQHGVALDSEGQVFCWGKGERGQLGQGRRMIHEDSDEQSSSDAPNENRTFEYAIQVSNFYDPFATKSTSLNDVYAPSLSKYDARVRLISAGMNFTVAVTHSNLPYIWGKNVCLDPAYSDSSFDPRSKEVQDSTYPRYIPGLPSDLRIERVACGTHHASMLLEDGSIWAVGIATDKPKPLWDEAVEILAPGVVDMNELVSFTAGFDRTSIVYGSDRRQVIEVQLWSTEELREHGAVRPSWVEWLEQEKGKEKVCSTHRGWMHSIVVTEE